MCVLISGQMPDEMLLSQPKDAAEGMDPKGDRGEHGGGMAHGVARDTDTYVYVHTMLMCIKSQFTGT